MKKYVVHYLVISFIFTACAPAQTPLPAGTSPEAPTADVTPTLTPFLTPTRLPTRTKAPTKTPLAPLALEEIRPGQQAYTFEAQSGVTLDYWLYIPENFDPSQQWPLILFLHGSDERGTTIDRLSSEIIEARSDLPFIVVTPQLDSGFWDKRIPDLNELLDQMIDTLPVNPDQIYLTGLSLGGFGTWVYALQHPDRFAAVAPIAGGYELGSELAPENICDIKDLPIWVFHGEADAQVAPFHSQILVDALRACGSDVIFTLYPDAGHISSWENAYADPALYEWFLSHTRTQRNQLQSTE